MATTQAILSNARYHTELIQSLDSLSNVPDALKEQVQLIQDLEKQIKDGKEELEKMSETTAEKRKIHEGVRDSMVMKTANTLVGRKGKYIARVEREESEYTEALENEMQQRAKLERLANRVDEISLTKLTLETKLERMQLLRNDITSLYSRVFNQPTSRDDFPRSHEAEQERRKAEEIVYSMQTQLSANRDAVTWLTEAKDLIYACWRYIEEGLTQYSGWATSGRSKVFPHMDRELRSAARSGLQAETLIEQARRGEPSIQVLPPLVVYEASMENMLRKDFPVTKAANSELLSKVKKNKEDLLGAQDTVASDIAAAKARIQRLENELPQAEEALRKAEKEVFTIRRQIWDEVTSGKDITTLGVQAPSLPTTPTGRARIPSIPHSIPPPPYQMSGLTKA